MGFWTDVTILVPKVTFKKLEDLVEEVFYLECDERLGVDGRRELAEQLAARVLDEYVTEYFGESTKAAAQMFRSRKHGRTMLLP